MPGRAYGDAAAGVIAVSVSGVTDVEGEDGRGRVREEDG